MSVGDLVNAFHSWTGAPHLPHHLILHHALIMCGLDGEQELQEGFEERWLYDCIDTANVRWGAVHCHASSLPSAPLSRCKMSDPCCVPTLRLALLSKNARCLNADDDHGVLGAIKPFDKRADTEVERSPSSNPTLPSIDTPFRPFVTVLKQIATPTELKRELKLGMPPPRPLSIHTSLVAPAHFQPSSTPHPPLPCPPCINHLHSHRRDDKPQILDPKYCTLHPQTYLQSDADEQLIITIPFTGQVKLKSFSIGSGKKTNTHHHHHHYQLLQQIPAQIPNTPRQESGLARPHDQRTHSSTDG
jgi:hypothetical protein